MDRRVDKREEKGRGIIKKQGNGREDEGEWRLGRWEKVVENGQVKCKEEWRRGRGKEKERKIRKNDIAAVSLRFPVTTDPLAVVTGIWRTEFSPFTFSSFLTRTFLALSSERVLERPAAAHVSGLSNDNPYTQISRLDCGKTREMRCPHAKEAVVFQKSSGNAGSESWWSLQQPRILAVNSHDKARTKSETAIPRDKMINVAKRKKIWPTWITWVTTYSD